VPVTAPPAVTKKSDRPAETSPIEPVALPVTLALDSRPAGAFVMVNGEKRGRTPLAVALEPGREATVRFSLPGYRSQERRVVPLEDDALVVRLKKKTRPKPSPIKTDF